METQIRGHGSLHPYYQERNRKGKEERAIETLKSTGYFDRNKLVDIDATKEAIESSATSGGGDQFSAPTTNPEADRKRNQASDMNAMLQQYGKQTLGPGGGAALGAAAGLALSDGNPLVALGAAGAGYFIGKNLLVPKGDKPFNPDLRIEGPNDDFTQPSESAEVQKGKAEISGNYIDESQLNNELAIAPSFTDTDENRSNAFAPDAITMLAQSAKTTGDQTMGNNMQPVIGELNPGVEMVNSLQGATGNVPNPADEFVTRYKQKVPSYLAATLGGLA